MSKVVFVKASYGRRVKFQIRTMGLLEDGAVSFRKEPIKSRKESTHLSDMVVARKLFEKKGVGNLFGDVKFDKGALYMDKIAGNEMEDMIVDSILDNNEKEVNRLLDIFEKVINSISINRKSIKNKGFPEIFKGKLEEYFDDKKVIYPGVVDINFDNIIVGKDGPKIIDYEWLFYKPIPSEYVLYRAIMWLSIRYSHLFKLHSKKIDFMSISEDMLIPKFMFKRYKGLLNNLQNSYDLERNYFQPWVNPNTIKEMKMDLKEYTNSLNFTLDNLADAQQKIYDLNKSIDSTMSEKDALISGNKKLETYISALKEEVGVKEESIKEKEKMNAIILNSNSYKLARAISLPIRFFRKIVRK